MKWNLLLFIVALFVIIVSVAAEWANLMLKKRDKRIGDFVDHVNSSNLMARKS